MLTIFSAFNYCEECSNKGAYVKILDNNLKPHTVHHSKKSWGFWYFFIFSTLIMKNVQCWSISRQDFFFCFKKYSSPFGSTMPLFFAWNSFLPSWLLIHQVKQRKRLEDNTNGRASFAKSWRIADYKTVGVRWTECHHQNLNHVDRETDTMMRDTINLSSATSLLLSTIAYKPNL